MVCQSINERFCVGQKVMKRYPAYKDSGVKWVGKIPSEWGLIRLKYLTSFRNGYAFDSDEYAEDGLPIMRIGDVSGSIDLEAMKKVPKDYEKLQYEFGINYGDVLLALTGATIGKTAVFNLHEKVLLNQRVAIIRPRKKLDNGYLKYIVAFSGFKRYIDFECEGGAQDNIGKGEVGDFLTPLPDLTEQKVIADYLDRKTAQIDDLISKKKRMIGLLKEERTAVINQAVTKGLDPKAEMKDSGIEWLGKVPKHWEIKRLKYVANINPQRPDGIPDETKVVFIAMESMNADGTYDNSIVRLYLEVKSGFTYFAEGDVIFAKITPCFENGKGALLRNLGTPIGFGSTEFHVLRAVKNKTISEYLYLLTVSGLFRGLGEAFMQGVAGQKRVTTDFVQDFIIGVPPVNEQAIISSYLEEKIKKIDTQIGRENKSIEYLKEFRTSLISEVVTGKIDVRG